MAEIWHQQENEPSRWFLRFEQFRMLGPARTLEAVYQAERKITNQKSERPTSGWYNNSKKWDWIERAEAWDVAISHQAIEEAEAARLEILRSGFAQKHERVKALNKIADLLLDDINSKLWFDDSKGIGSGKNYERVDIERFNGALVSEFRKTLEDIAAELGERVKKSEVSGPDGDPIAVEDIASVREKRWLSIAEKLAGLEEDERGDEK